MKIKTIEYRELRSRDNEFGNVCIGLTAEVEEGEKKEDVYNKLKDMVQEKLADETISKEYYETIKRQYEVGIQSLKMDYSKTVAELEQLTNEVMGLTMAKIHLLPKDEVKKNDENVQVPG